MSTLNKLKKLLHRKVAEYCAPLAAGITVAGGFLVSDKTNLVPGHDSMFYVGGASTIWNYNADEDAWLQLPNSGIAGTFASGSCGEYRALSAPSGVFTQTATGGATGVNGYIATSLSLKHNCRGFTVRIVEGPGAGYVGTIVASAVGNNANLYVTPALSVAPTTATKFQIFGGSFWFFNAGTTAVGFSVYDRITNSWTARSVTNLPTSWGTDGQLVSTKGQETTFFQSRVASASNALVTLNAADFVAGANLKLTNFQARVISGTGAGQIRSMTGAVDDLISVSSAFSPQLDNTSVIAIEGNEDYFYLMGNNAVTMYRFSVSSNTWSALSPTTARGGAAGAGCMGCWIDSVPDPEWSKMSPRTHVAWTGLIKQNGRYIYSFRGGATNTLDAYDIAQNLWINGIAYAGQNETYSTGCCAVDDEGMIYIMQGSTGRFHRFDVAQNTLEPFFFTPIPNSTVVTGDKVTIQTYNDGGDDIKYLYALSHSRTELIRTVIV